MELGFFFNLRQPELSLIASLCLLLQSHSSNIHIHCVIKQDRHTSLHIKVTNKYGLSSMRKEFRRCSKYLNVYKDFCQWLLSLTILLNTFCQRNRKEGEKRQRHLSVPCSGVLRSASKPFIHTKYKVLFSYDSFSLDGRC